MDVKSVSNFVATAHPIFDIIKEGTEGVHMISSYACLEKMKVKV